MRTLSSLLFLLMIGLLASCGNVSTTPEPNPDQSGTLKADYVNPFPEGTYEHFTAEPDYRKTYNVFRNTELLAKTNGSNASLRMNLYTQRAQLMNDGQVAMDYPISTGRMKYPTPPGSYTITEKLKDKRSNLYGKIYDADGNLINGDADTREHEVPEGGKYVGAPMPYWMRMTGSGIGHHVGRVPRYPASHGCIRGPSSVLPTVYSKVRIGTPVIVE